MKTYLLVAGICLQTAAATGQDTSISQKIKQLENGLLPAIMLKGQPPQVYKLEERMQHYHVPAVSIAFIDNGRIAWAKAYGYLNKEDNKKADTLTLFQAASISKPFTITLAFKLVEQGRLLLDEAANKYLTSWKIKPSPFTAQKPVTLRHLLTSTAGLSVQGFHGYAEGSPLPTTVQILNGEPSANSAPVVSIDEPGANYHYSGGGYVVIKQLIEDVTGQSFPELMQQQVLAPAGMPHSTFEQPLPRPLQANASAGHDVHGITLPGKWNTMAEIAPDGLWSTPADLARYLIKMVHSLKGTSSAILSPAVTAQMVGDGNRGAWSNPADTRGWIFTGHNDGYCAEMMIIPGKEQGIVIMTNGDYGSRLIAEIVRGAAQAYHWKGFEPAARSVIKLDAQTLQSYAGRYQGDGMPWHVDINVQGNHLLAKVTLDGSESALYPESEERFFSLEEGLEVTFLKGPDRVVAGLNVQGSTLKKIF